MCMSVGACPCIIVEGVACAGTVVAGGSESYHLDDWNWTPVLCKSSELIGDSHNL